MALSCLYRTGQRFGVNYVIDVLLGKDHPRIIQNKHHEVSIFGIGHKTSNIEWRGIFRQLIALGYIYSDGENFGALKLNPICKPLLRGEETLSLRRIQKQAASK